LLALDSYSRSPDLAGSLQTILNAEAMAAATQTGRWLQHPNNQSSTAARALLQLQLPLTVRFLRHLAQGRKAHFDSWAFRITSRSTVFKDIGEEIRELYKLR